MQKTTTKYGQITALFPLYWELGKCTKDFFFFFDTAILKVAEKWKLRFDYNAFLLHHQDTRTRTPLHYVYVRK